MNAARKAADASTDRVRKTWVEVMADTFLRGRARGPQEYGRDGRDGTNNSAAAPSPGQGTGQSTEPRLDLVGGYGEHFYVPVPRVTPGTKEGTRDIRSILALRRARQTVAAPATV